jgi:putative peptidoglycan lipid II flippase
MAKDSIEKESATNNQQSDGVQQDGKDRGDQFRLDTARDAKGDSEVEVIPAIAAGDPGQAEPVVSVLEVETEENGEGAGQKGESNGESASEDEAGQPSERREMVKSASLVALGNLSSSLMGMVRQSFLAATGATISAPFLAAILPAQRFNDFIINGSAQSALVPVFNDYAVPEKREELRRLIFTIVNLVLLVMTISSVIYFFIAPWFVPILAPGLTAAEKALTLEYTRIIFFSLMALGPFSVLEASLYAQKEFGWTSVASTSYHVGIIIGALVTTILGNHYFGAYGLPSGVILGALGEIGLLVPAMRRRHMRYMLVLDLHHPALRPMLRLYIPAACSFFFTAALALLDQHLATQTPCMAFMAAPHERCGDVNLSAMAFATLLIQFPGGLVASALSFAVLPTLTAYMRNNDLERFKSMLLLGFRLGLLLMIPAAAGLIVLQLPIVQVLFMHKNFTYDQSVLTGIALQNYSYQLPFLAIDQLLLAAFYARKNALLPVIVYIVSILGYLAVALPFWQTIGMPALALANAAQNIMHAVVLFILLRRAIGSLHLRGIVPALLKILLATAVLILVAWGLQYGLAHALSSVDTFIRSLIIVVVAGGVAGGIYFGLLVLLKVEEVSLLKGAVMAKLGKRAR